MPKRVAIIGGGYTGLTAALRLAQAGMQVEVLEKGLHLGGLAYGFPLLGTHIEAAYHHLFQSDTDIIALAKELGVASALEAHDSSVAIIYQNHLFPFATPLDLLRFTPLSFFSRVRLGAVLWYLQHRKQSRAFDGIAAAQWLRRACGEAAYRIVWEPLLVGKFHTFANDVSMAWLWARIHTRATSRSRGGQREKLVYVRGGFHVLTQALAQALERAGVQTRFHVTVESIHSAPSGAVEVMVDGVKHAYDAVVCTTPSHIFRRLIAQDTQATPAYLEQLQSMQYLGALCAVFSSTQSLSPYYWHNIHDTHAPFLVFLQHTNLVSPAAYQNQHVYYLGTYLPHDHVLFTTPEAQVQEQFFRYLQRCFSDFDASQVTSFHLSHFPNAQHVVDTRYRRIRPDVQTPLRNVFLSNFSQIFPEDRGTNFAVRAGEDVARLVTQALRTP